MKFNISAGHNPDGKVACGASSRSTNMYESTEARYLTKKVIEYLKADGHTVYNCTCDNGSGQTDVLNKIIAKCNTHSVDLDVSIHFNSGAENEKGNGKTTGVEVLYVNDKVIPKCEIIGKNIASIGFKNRGVKERTGLKFLNKTNSKALLIEVCFVDDLDDAKVYKANKDKIARAIADGIEGKTYKPSTSTVKPKPQTNNTNKGDVYMKTLVTYLGDADVFGAIVLAQKNKCALMKVSDYEKEKANLKVDKVIQVGGNANDTNRFETFKNVAKQL